MSKGGARVGAGRKKGIPNRFPTVRAVHSAGDNWNMILAWLDRNPDADPIMTMLNVIKNGSTEHIRLKAAAECAPYFYSRLATITHKRDPAAPDEGAIQRLRELLTRRESEPPLLVDVTPAAPEPEPAPSIEAEVIPLHKSP